MGKLDTWETLRRTWAFTTGATQFIQSITPPPKPPPPDPMAGMATPEELENYRFDPDGFYLGRIHSDHGVNFEASLSAKEDRHVFIVAGNASGKGVTYGIQNAIRWKGGLLAIDPKGEMAEIAGIRRGRREDAIKTGTSVRQFVGQKVAILDPMNQVSGAAKKFRVKYDPLSDIDIKNPREAKKRIRKLAAGMVIPEDGKNAHFSESAETLIAGTIEAVLYTEKPENHRLPFVRQILNGQIDIDEDASGLEALGLYLTQNGIPLDSHAAEAASMLSEVIGSDEAGAFKTTISRNLKWMIDDDMQDHLQPSGFSLWKAVQENWSVFLVLNPDDIGDFKNWLRMNTQMALSAKMALGTNQQGLQTLFFLDEFSVLGRFKEIEEKAGYMRGYGVKLVPMIQNIGQIKNLYAKNWETFLGNAAVIIAWGLNDGETEKYISDRYGKIIVEETTHSYNQGVAGLGGNQGQGQTTGKHERMIRLSNEIHELGARKTMRGFIIPADGKGFTVERVPYMALEKNKIFDSPEHIRQWEEKNG